jgi:hypothetical protein
MPLLGKKLLALLAMISLFTSGCDGCLGSRGSNPTPNPTRTHPSAAQSNGIDPALLAKAEAGDPEAERQVGVEYANGKMVPQDFTEAAMWYQKAAEQGNARAQRDMGLLYETGQEHCSGCRQYFPQDYSKAVRWFRTAAEQGDAEAEVNLGLMYGRGEGVPQDDAQANVWFRKAAEQGNATAQFDLGISYRDGLGVQQDHAQAAIWFRKAAEQGYARSKVDLDEIQRENEGSEIRSYWPTTIRVDTDMDSFWLPDEERTCQTYPDYKGRVSVVACNPSGSHRDHNIPVTFWGDPNRDISSDWKCQSEKSIFGDRFVCRAID